MNKRRNKEIRK